MTIDSLPLEGLRLLTLPHFPDERGSFTKTFHEPTLRAAGIDFTLRESYFSLSKKDVVRGMHFQTPPHDHAKIVFCPAGAILDVAVDLRKASATYGRVFSQELSARNHLALYLPAGFAHGFKALTDDAMTYYLVSSAHSKDHDAGIRWDSIPFDWAVQTPILSARDAAFPALADFDTPF